MVILFNISTYLFIIFILLFNEITMRQVDSIESISINLLSFFTPHLLEEYTCTQDLDRLEVIFKRIEPFFEYENKQLSSINNANFNEKSKKITEEIIKEDFREPVQKKLILN